MIPIPGFVWRRVIRATGGQVRASVGFMTDDHRRVRDLAVLELARTGAPLSPHTVADRLALGADGVRTILDDLERHKTFLYRSKGEDITWAYPVTVDETPHRAAFSTGEEAFSP